MCVTHLYVWMCDTNFSDVCIFVCVTHSYVWICVVNHLYVCENVWHESFIRVCDPLTCVHVWRDSFMCVHCIDTVWHDSFICVHMYMCMAHSYVWMCVTNHPYLCDHSYVWMYGMNYPYVCDPLTCVHVWYDSFMCVHHVWHDWFIAWIA